MKYIFYLFLNSLIIKQILSIEIIPKKGQITTYDNMIMLDISGVEKNYIISISIIVEKNYPEDILYYNFYENIDGTDENYFEPKYSKSPVSSSSSYSSKTFYYEIKKVNGKANYLYMKYYFVPPVTIYNTGFEEEEESLGEILIYWALGVVMMALIIISIVCCCKKCGKKPSSGVAIYPISNGNNVLPYTVQAVIPSGQQVINAQPSNENIIQPNQNPNNIYPNFINIQNPSVVQGTGYIINQ